MYSLFCLFIYFQIPFVLSSNSDNSQFNLYENRLAAFPTPDFNTTFVLRSQKGFKSFKEIRHGLGVEPFYVRVYAKPKSGANKGFAFNGVGTNQVDARYSSYGGLIYAYNSEYIRIWAPTQSNGYIIYIKDGWGNERYSQKTGKAIVVVEMWKSGPEPNFQIDTVIGNGTNRGSYGEVDHQLGQFPDRVLVSVSPENPVSSNENPNGGFWFHATGSSQNSFTNSSYGGVIFAYNERIIRLWAPDENLKETGCILIDKGWGDGKYSQRVTRCRVLVKVWVNMLPIPSFQTKWFSFQAQRGMHSFKTIQHNLNAVPELVLVQTRPLQRMNYHFIFEAQGSVQSDDNSGAYGGVTFAYDQNTIHLWAPTKHDGTKKGYGVLVKEGWGDNRFMQNNQDIDIEVRILLFSSKCKQSTEACFVNNTCMKTEYDSYTWVMSSWTNCSSICNKGRQSRHSTGCLVKSKSIIPHGSCDFEKDFCGWTQTALTSLYMNWKRTNTTTLTANTGPLWGHPKGSYYVYTYSKNVVPNGLGTLTSPYIYGARRCHLTFFWNMYGKEIGELSVEARTGGTGEWDEWRKTGWSMKGSQGPYYWRSAYINLEHYSKIYGLRFLHSLPKRPDYCKDHCLRCTECSVCDGGRCLYVNVAIDDIQLWCEASYNITDTSECKARNAKYAGCDVTSTVTNALKHLRGPAYGEEQVYYAGEGLRTFVNTVGSKYDLVAPYSVNVVFKAYYSLWMSVYSTNETNNKVGFRIDEGDWHDMNTAWKTTHHLWLNYRPKLFLLWPGVHTITFRQLSINFRFDKIALTPTKLSNWVDLGMQSRHIPDSYITARPPKGARPEPWHGRLLKDAAGWCSTDHNAGFIYLQIKLPGLALLSRIAVQGAKDLDQKSNNYWTKNYKLKVSIDDGELDHFTWYRNRTDVMLFNANTDSYSIVEVELPYAVPVRAVRLFPFGWENWPCMRVELYGVYLTNTACANSGPKLPTVKPCMGNRDCGSNADCQKANTSKGIRKTIGDLWRRVFPTSNISTTEYCTCVGGFHGASCQHYGCTPNPCDNNGTCSQNSLNGTFSCKCPPGFYGDFCQKSCQPGYYGYNCSQKCQCSEHSSCDEATGHCSCYKGFKGKYCDYKCTGGYHGYECAQKCQCQNGASCHHVTGACNCTIGWTGKFCDQQCPWNSWGKFCLQNCSCTYSALECNRKTGECLCDDGYLGRYCAKSCSSGKYGWNCTQTCSCAKNSQCSKTDGTCNCTESGFTGVLCKQPCPHGFYGVGCQQQCLCKNGGDCNRVTGKCTCTSGWHGKLCDTSCPQGSWGLNCTQRCSCSHGAQCNAATGQCVCDSGCSCDGGWSGTDCKVPCGEDKWGAGCSSTCTCKNSAVCHTATGKCTCHPGFSGSNCEHPCVPGYYGNNCSLPCNCNTSTSSRCDAITGACKCLAGRQGQLCDIPCSKGLRGINCNSTCRCVHGSCHPINGNCVCDARWQGALCNQPCNNCGIPCPKCYHGNCNPSKSQCICNVGYSGSVCVESCPSGFYGQGCQHRCACVHGVCRPDSGMCDCHHGWTGNKCDQVCPSGLYGYNCLQKCTCINGSCNPVNGSCSCNKGYHGNDCSRPCPTGFYGSGCLSNCQCSNGTSCDYVTGKCLCKSGLMGRKCDTRCKPGFYGVNCTARCLCKSCDPSTGSCHCPPGLQGLRCTQPCPSGYYGNNCSQTCQCANSGFCNHVDGTCTCRPGWRGATCEDHCRPGRYGMQCLSTCNCALNVTEVSQPCHHITGTCNCSPGYQGLRCLDQCLSNFYGKNCTQKCLCRNDGICNFVDGSCSCPPGYHGQHCEMTCPPGRYGTNCNNTCGCIQGHTLTCNRVDGTCTCADGYIGVSCENRCPEGKFGPGCHGNCQCKNNAHCNHMTGACVCPSGYKGKHCGEKCTGFMFGPGCRNKCLCENGATCNPFTGECYCQPGYSGIRCSSECLEGRFGIDCVNICDCNPSNTKTCDSKDGTCHCNPGYTHRRCDQTCKDGFYGEKCMEHCPQCSRHITGPCNKQHGNCTCSPGYYDYQCYDDCPLKSFGLHCKYQCMCPKDQMCYHVNGTCLPYQQGLFHLVIKDPIAMFDDADRKQDFKIGIEKLMYKYYDKLIRDKSNKTSVASQNKDNDKSRTPPAFDVAPMAPSTNTSESSPTPVPPKNDFVVRIIDIEPVFLDKTAQGTRIGAVVMNGEDVLNASDVMDVLRHIPNSEISNLIAAKYYTGKLYVPPKTSNFIIHLPLIIGASVGVLLIIIILVSFKLRYKYSKKGSKVNKKTKKDPAEFELLPYMSHGSSNVLAFENPYYDVLAAMGLDDDLGEEYSNPLYDDVSLYSGDSYNGSSDYSYHKEIAHMIVR